MLSLFPWTAPEGAARAVEAKTGSETSSDRPNIILILTDDLDARSIAFTPRLQSLLADRGTTFANAFVNVALCCPSRATILRGQYAHNTGILTNRPPNGGFETFHALGHEDSTVATWLQAAGYRTALLGKYLNGYPNGVDPTYVPPGWDEWHSPVGGNPYSEYDYRLNENGQVVAYGSRPEDYMIDLLGGRASDVIRRASAEGEPFFVYLAPYAPHGPATPAPRHQNEFAGATVPRSPSFDEEDVGDKPEWLRSRPPLSPEVIARMDELYRKRLQSMLAVEDMLEGLVRTLEATGQLENTYIVFTSDNGFHLGEHRQPQGKSTAYEEDIRVPLIVRGPGVPAGRVVDGIAGNIDLAPTFADLVGVAAPDFVNGRSLVPLLRGETRVDGWREAFLVEHGALEQGGARAARRARRAEREAGRGRPAAPTADVEPSDTAEDETSEADETGGDRTRRARARARQAVPELQALRTGDRLYVEYVTGERELYDLRADPYQLESLHATADPALLAQLSSWLDALRRCSGAGCHAAELGAP